MGMANFHYSGQYLIKIDLTGQSRNLIFLLNIPCACVIPQRPENFHRSLRLGFQEVVNYHMGLYIETGLSVKVINANI